MAYPLEDRHTETISKFRNFITFWNRFISEISTKTLAPSDEWLKYYNLLVLRNLPEYEFNLLSSTRPNSLTKYHHLAILLVASRIREATEQSDAFSSNTESLVFYANDLLGIDCVNYSDIHRDGEFKRISKAQYRILRDVPLIYNAIYLAQQLSRADLVLLIKKYRCEFDDYLNFIRDYQEKKESDEKFIIFKAIGGGLLALVVLAQTLAVLYIFAKFVFYLILAAILPVSAFISYSMYKDSKEGSVAKTITGALAFVLIIASIIWFFSILDGSSGNYIGDCVDEGGRVVCS
jgi:hypothetical protein